MLQVTYSRISRVVDIKKTLAFLVMFFLSCRSALAEDDSSTNLNVEEMLLSLQQSLPELANLAIGGAYVMGIAFIFKGLYDMKMYGESRTMMSGHNSIKAPLFYMFIGAMCIYSPSAFHAVMLSTFGYSSVLSYEELNVSQSLSDSAIVVLQIVQVIGIYAFFRGWILLARSSSGQGGHGLFGRGLIHVVGGIFAMNIVGTINVILATFGISV